MSHFTTVATVLQNKNTLIAALKRLSWNFTEAQSGQMLLVQGWEGASMQAHLVIDSGCKYSIGVIIQENGTCTLEADWWAIETYTGRNQEAILNQLTHQYAYCTVMDRIQSLGYSLVEERQQENQELRLVVRKWN